MNPQPFLADGQRLRVRGRVRNQQRRALPGVSVTLTDGLGVQIGLTRTDHNGEFEIQGH